MELRDYQKRAIQTIVSKRDGGTKRQLASLFTGAGKTVLFAQLPQYARPNKRTMVIVHTDVLCQQAMDKIKHWNPNLSVGLEKADFHAGNAQVVVGSIQSLGRGNGRIDQFRQDDFDWLVIDEAHHAVADSYKNVIRHFGLIDPDVRVATTLVGFTATGERADGKALGEVFDEIVYNYGALQAVRDGWLVTPRGYTIRTETDISGVAMRAGDFAQDELELAVNNPARNELVAREWIDLAWPRPTVMFCVDIQHAKDQAYAFQKAGVPFEFIHGGDKHGKEKLKMFEAGKLQGLCNAQLLIEGFDMWQVSCTIHGRPSRSKERFQQEAGRALRLQEGTMNLEEARRRGLLLPHQKVDALILGVCDISKHSLVSLPTLFGLSPKLDLRGKSIIEVLDEFEEADKANPGIDLSQLEDATKLKSLVEEVNLWQVKFSEETAPFSKLMWHKGPSGNFVLLLPGKDERLVVGENLLGKWCVWGKVGGVGVDEPFYSSLQEALANAEQIVATLGKRAASYLQKDAKWAVKKVTPEQRGFLKKWRVPEAQINSMTSGQASALITKLIKDAADRRATRGARQ
jgi:ATP-dependent helicase IRC3